MRWKLLQIIALAGATAASSVAAADDSGLRIEIPMPPPTSRPSAQDISQVTDAKTLFGNVRRDAAVARANVIKAQEDLNRITRILQSQLETNGAVADLKNEVSAAKTTFDEFTRSMLASLAEHAPYREARAAVARAQHGVDALGPDAGIEERLLAAQAVLRAKAAVAQLENDALKNNSDAVKAKKTYLEATQRLKETRVQLSQALRQDPTYIAASQAVDDARQRAVAADQKLVAARQDVFAAQRRLADKREARQEIEDWTYQHGLPIPP